MPQRRFRNDLSCGEDMARRRNNAARASGDSTATTISQHRDIRAKSQDKLPRSVRYELENALIGLCDVWFDEIKPHLVRNNIKLHVKGRQKQTGSSTCGDQQSTRTAPPAPPSPSSPLLDDCSHLDPASSPGCKLCQLLATAASCIESAGWEGADTAPPSPVSCEFYACDTSIHDCGKKQGRPSIRRKRRRFRAQDQPSWRVPRLCRTQPALGRGTSGAGGLPTGGISQLPSCENYYRFIVPHRESVMKNKATQTEAAGKVSRACQARSPDYRSSVSRSPGLRDPGLRGPGQRSPAPRSPPPSSRKRSPTSYNSGSASPDRPLSPLVPPPSVTCQLKRSEVNAAGLPTLLKDDLIDIIAASHEKRLKLLYSSSERDDYPSFLNLYPNCKPEKMSPKKLPPWR